jgi:hypothetical protein
MKPDDNKPDDGWGSLAAAWQAQPVDLDSLRRATARRTRRMQLLMALDIFFVVAAAAGAVLLFFNVDNGYARAAAVVGLASVALALLLNWRLRRGLWRASGDSAVDLLKLQRKRCVNALRMAQWGPLFLPLGALTGTLVARGEVPKVLSLQLPPTYKLVLLAVLVIGFCAGTVLYVRRQRRRIAAIDAHLAQLESAS